MRPSLPPAAVCGIFPFPGDTLSLIPAPFLRHSPEVHASALPFRPSPARRRGRTLPHIPPGGAWQTCAPPSVPTREKSRLKEHPLPEQQDAGMTQSSAPAPRPPGPNGKSGERRRTERFPRLLSRTGGRPVLRKGPPPLPVQGFPGTLPALKSRAVPPPLPLPPRGRTVMPSAQRGSSTTPLLLSPPCASRSFPSFFPLPAPDSSFLPLFTHETRMRKAEGPFSFPLFPPFPPFSLCCSCFLPPSPLRPLFSYPHRRGMGASAPFRHLRPERRLRPVYANVEFILDHCSAFAYITSRACRQHRSCPASAQCGAFVRHTQGASS